MLNYESFLSLILEFLVIYNRFLVPNNLTEDEEYLANDAIPMILEALRKFEFNSIKVYHSLFIITSIDIPDPTGEVAIQMQQKYLADAVMGNFTSMTPGLTDVKKTISCLWKVLIEILTWIVLEQICSVLFLKDPTWELIRLTSPYESNGFFYSFEFDARNSLYTYLFVGDRPPIPHGNFFLLAIFNPNYLISHEILRSFQ